MTDFIQIKEDIFQMYRSIENSTISSKLNEVLDKYPCFQDYSAFHSYKTKRNVSHHNTNTKYHKGSHTVPYQQRKKIVKEGQNDFDRIVTALLNKLSKQNYRTIANQILKVCVNDTSVQVVVESILRKCQRQPCFLDLYVKILEEIYLNSCFECRHYIKNYLTRYIDDFIGDRKFSDFKLNSTNYDQFCFNLDNKSQIIGKHKTVLALIKDIMRDHQIDDYFDIMFKEIVLMDEGSIFNEEFEKHELLLDLMTDFVKEDHKYQILITKYYKTNLDCLYTYPLKARFKVMDMTAIVL